MKTSHLKAARVSAALILALGLACSATATVTAASQPVHTATTSAGKVLVNMQGRTLYVFAADSPGKSTCTGTCARAWPPAITTARTLGHSPDVKARLSVIKRSDGKTQLAVNGLPAYTYSGDTAPGQDHGQGLNASGGLWWVISPSGVPIKKAPASTGSGTAPSGAPTPSYDYLY